MIRAFLRHLGRVLLAAGTEPEAVRTNRSQELRAEDRTPVDDCAAYMPGAPAGDGPCETDGHYLCEGCTLISEASLVRRGLASRIEDRPEDPAWMLEAARR